MLSWAIIVCLASISRAHITVLSWEPRIHLHHGMLDENEIAHLLALSSSRFAASELEVGANDQRRTSESWMVPRTVERDDAVVAGAVKRMHAAVGIPPRYGEALQVARYNSTRNYYNFHADSAKSTARVATVLIYLERADEGGETIFPFVRNASSAPATLPPPVDFAKQVIREDALDAYCASDQHLRLAPEPGDALVFWNFQPDHATVERERLWHAACPVKRGRKVVAQRWVRSMAAGDLPPSWLDDSGAAATFCPRQRMPAGEYTCDDAAWAGFSCADLAADGYACAGCRCPLDAQRGAPFRHPWDDDDRPEL